MNEKKLSNIKSRSADVARNEGMSACTWVEKDVELEMFSTQTCKDIQLNTMRTVTANEI